MENSPFAIAELTLSLREIEEAVNPVPEDMLTLFNRLLSLFGPDLYRAVVAPLYVASLRRLKLPIRLLQVSCKLEQDPDQFQQLVLDQLTHLFVIDKEELVITALGKPVFEWTSGQSKDLAQIRPDETEAHLMLAKLCEALLDHPKCRQYCRSYLIWHLCMSDQFQRVNDILTTNLELLIKVVQYGNAARDLDAYYTPEMSSELKQVLSILTNGDAAIAHDYREVVSQILGRSNSGDSVLWRQAADYRFTYTGSWKPVKATLVSFRNITLVNTLQLNR